MSDSEDAFSDELLELAGATEKKRKSRQASGSGSAGAAGASAKKKRKADSDSEDEPESEEDDSNPYPLEGKYVDEDDRNKLMQLSEIEREHALAQRLEERQRIQDKRNLDQMLKAQRGEGDSVAKAAKRSHTSRGATKEKTRKLDELKAKRKAKDEKKKVRTNSPKRDRSTSPMDMEMSSSSEDEDGQITRYDEEEEREQKLLDKVLSSSIGSGAGKEEKATMEDLMIARVTREDLRRFCMAPWFEEYIKGAWVRYLIGNDKSGSVYRICEISNLGPDIVKPYRIEDQLVDRNLELRHGNAQKVFPMDKVSNAPWDKKEFDRLVLTCETDKVKLPSKRALEKKKAQLDKLTAQRWTESDVSEMLKRKSMMQSSALHTPAFNRSSSVSIAMERSRLAQERTLALRRQDHDEVVVIDAKLAELNANGDAGAGAGGGTTAQSLQDKWAKVNERNRKANMEAIRKAEVAESERRRKEREKRLAAGASASPAGVDRVKMENATPFGSPSPNRSVSPLPPATGTPEPGKPLGRKALESIMVSSVDVDLGDF